MDLPLRSLTGEGPAFLGHLSPEQPFRGCREDRDYLIGVPARCWSARLYVDDAPLPFDDHRQAWRWSPGFFAGEVALELELPGEQTPVRYVVDVGPAEHKTGREQYVEYLRQIVDYAPQLVLGSEPARHGLGGRSGTRLTAWLRYARLRSFIDRYLTGLKAIADRPIIRLDSHREQLPAHMARRVDTTTLNRLVSNPALLADLAGDPSTSMRGVSREKRLDVPFSEPTMDNPANRLMARQVSEVRRLVRHLHRDFDRIVAKESDTETDVAARMPRRLNYLQGLEKRLTRHLRSEPLSEANTAIRSAAELNAVSGNPHYNMAYRQGVRILREGVSDLADDEQHYLTPTWAIYESWCFVVIARQLEAMFPDMAWCLETDATYVDMILSGTSDARAITLYAQMTCRSLESRNSYGYCSISRERRPDLVLEWRDDAGVRYACLDSKYTAKKARILDSMASAHIYNDSLRLAGRKPELSLILVPRNLAAGKLESLDFWDKHRVGCFSLTSGEQAPELIERVLSVLQRPVAV